MASAFPVAQVTAPEAFGASEGEICLKSQMPEQILNSIVADLLVLTFGIIWPRI